METSIINAATTADKLGSVGILALIVGVLFYLLKDKKNLEASLDKLSNAIEKSNEINDRQVSMLKEWLDDKRNFEMYLKEHTKAIELLANECKTCKLEQQAMRNTKNN